jgi:uncharacterized protein
MTLLLVPADSPQGKQLLGKAAAADELEFSGDEAEIETYEGDHVDLDPLIRDALLLEVPQFPLCTEDCQGMRPPPDDAGPSAGGVDPRLAPLLKFSKKRS